MILPITIAIIVLVAVLYSAGMFKEGFRRNPSIRRDSLYSYSYKPSRRMDKNDWRWFLYPPVAYIPYDEVNPYSWYPYGWSPYFGTRHPYGNRPYGYGRPLGPWTNELDLGY